MEETGPRSVGELVHRIAAAGRQHIHLVLALRFFGAADGQPPAVGGDAVVTRTVGELADGNRLRGTSCRRIQMLDPLEMTVFMDIKTLAIRKPIDGLHDFGSAADDRRAPVLIFDLYGLEGPVEAGAGVRRGGWALQSDARELNLVGGVDSVRQGAESDVERTLQVQAGGCTDLMQRLPPRGQENGE